MSLRLTLMHACGLRAPLAVLAFLVGTSLAVGPSSPAMAIEFLFDYSLDTTGFFNDPTRRATLELAGDRMSRFVDELDAIEPSGGNTWLAAFFGPDGGFRIESNLVIPADTILVYAGAQDLPGNALAGTTAIAVQATGTPEWQETVTLRGQAGAAQPGATDFGPVGASVSFDPLVPWHFEATDTGLTPLAFDFLTLATHELGHVLGFGSAPSFGNLVSAGQFTGPQAQSVGSSNNPQLDLADPSHWQLGTLSTVAGNSQVAVMDPFFFGGERRQVTALDLAALDDVGWEPARAGDANSDRSVDAVDLAAAGPQFGSGTPSAWTSGDWDDDGVTTALDLLVASPFFGIAYEASPAAAGAGQPTITYFAETGRLVIDTDGNDVDSYLLESASGIFSAASPNLRGGTPFLTDTDELLAENFFDPVLNGVHDLGLVAQAGLAEAFLLSDLTLRGGLSGSENFDFGLVFVAAIPEPATGGLVALGLAVAAWTGLRRRRRDSLHGAAR